MEDRIQKENVFDIDIDKFNANFKSFLLSELKEIYRRAEDQVKNLYVHLGIRQSKENPLWDGTQMGATTYLFSSGDYMLNKQYSEDGSEDKDSGYKGTEEQSKKVMQEEMKNKLKRQWTEYEDENVVFGWGDRVLKCQIIDKVSGKEKLIGDYDVLWAVCNVKNDKPVVNKLIIQIVLMLLQECFRDINEIQEIGNCENASAVLKKLAENIKFKFIKWYVEKVFEKYKELPCEEDCRKLSLMPYEKRECKGKVLLINEKEFYKDNKGKIVFDTEKVETEKINLFSNIRYTRKMLEACQKDHYLVVDDKDHRVLGLEHSDLVEPGGLVIEYEGIANWKIEIQEEEILCYKGGDYYISKESYKRSIRDKLEGIEGLEIEKCLEIINQLKGTEHGALMIIAPNADSEAERLCKKYERGTRIEVLPLGSGSELNQSGIIGMASVDGAILVDFKGNCVAFGVILDGEAKTKGDIKSGSRHNSARNYVAGKNMIAVIVSEDRQRGIEIAYGLRDVEVIE